MKNPVPGLAILALLLISSLSACGNKGPLYLPAPDATAQQDASEKGD